MDAAARAARRYEREGERMKCPECRGKGTAIYYRETDRDENSVTVRKFEDICHTCHGSGRKPQTNADRIRAMSEEELAALLLDGCRGAKCSERSEDEFGSVDCFGCRIDWLKQPAKDGENDG